MAVEAFGKINVLRYYRWNVMSSQVLNCSAVVIVVTHDV